MAQVHGLAARNPGALFFDVFDGLAIIVFARATVTLSVPYATDRG
jgi:hypothetical protein